MRMNKLKLFVVSFLLGAALVMTGCSTGPYPEKPSEKSSESPASPIKSGVFIPKREEGSDDMERLD